MSMIDVPSALQHPRDLSAERPVQVAVHLRRLGELARLALGDELVAGQEVVVLAVDLARPRLARRARHRIPDVGSPLEQLARDRRLSAARRRREDDGKWVHSRFSTCSRIRSSSSLIRITSCRIAASFALLPGRVRLAQELLQQEAESLPHAVGRGGDASVARNAAKCGVKATDLFGHVEPVGEDGDLLREPLLVDCDAVGQLADRGAQAGRAVRPAAPARARRCARPSLLDDRQALLEVRREPRSLRAAHLDRAPPPPASTIADELGRRPLARRLPAPRRCSAAEAARRRRSRRPSPCRRWSSRSLVDVGGEPRFVDSERRRTRSRSTRASSVTCPRAIAAPQRLAHVAFPACELARELDRRIEEPVVDRADLDRDARARRRRRRPRRIRSCFLSYRGPYPTKRQRHLSIARVGFHHPWNDQRRRRSSSVAASRSWEPASSARRAYCGTATRSWRRGSGSRAASRCVR